MSAAAGAPLIVPGSAVAQALALGRRIRAEAGPAGITGKILTLTPAQERAVTALAEAILPRTDTPGATDAEVTAFIDTILTGWLDDDDRDRFLAGVDSVDEMTRAAHGSAFADCTPEQQAEITARMDEETDRLRQDPDEDETQSFFYLMKSYTLSGYFTSRPGLQALGYRVVHQDFKGCVSLGSAASGGCG